MKALNLLSLSLAALLAACDDPSPVSTDQPQAVASGRVTTVDQRPVASAQVVLFDLANLRQGPSQTVQTDANGYFALAYQPGRAYALSVYGEGLATHIIPSFEPSDVGFITMHKATQPPSAKKLTGAGILGDVDGNGVVDQQDLIRIALYALDDAADVLDTGDILLGDIDADGAVTFYDAYLVWLYLSDPAHPLLPPGIGLPPSLLTPDPTTIAFAPDGAWHPFIVHADAPVVIVANPAASNPIFALANTVGRDGWCPAEANDEETQQSGQRIYLAACGAGTGTVEVRSAADGSVVQTYTIEVAPPAEPSRLSILPPTLDFGRDKTSLRLSLKNIGGGLLNFTIESVPDWITLSQTQGILADEALSVEVQINRAQVSLSSVNPVLVVVTSDERREVPLRVNISAIITQLTDHPAEDVVASWSPDSQRIAFWSERDGNKQVYVMDADGQNITRLTHHPADDWEPSSWSPDGHRIAFSSKRNGNDEIYTMDADGHNLVRLTYHDADDRHASWSPDGRRITFTSLRDGNWEIYTMDADGHNLVRLTYHDADDKDPTWSPDGRRIAFSSKRNGSSNVYVMDADGQNITRLTYHDADDRGPSWSPDGERITFPSLRDGDWELYVVDADGHNLVRLTCHPDRDWGPEWSPDGKHLAFSSFREGNWNVYLLTLSQFEGCGG